MEVPNIKSAKKRVLVNEKKRERNRAINSEVKTAIKKFNNAINTNQIDEAEKLLPATFAMLDGAVTKGIIHKNNAANKKSALAKRLSDIKGGKIVIEVKKDNKTIAAEKAVAAKEARDAIRAENAKKAAERNAQKVTADDKKVKKTTKKGEEKVVKEVKEVKKRTKKADPLI
jgi:small subunit ribosomal protein S20